MSSIRTVRQGGIAAVVVALLAAMTLTLASPPRAHAASAPAGAPASQQNPNPSPGCPGAHFTPSVTAVDPTSGTTAGGTVVTVTGKNLGGATAVSFGSTAAPTGFTVNCEGTALTVTSPAHDAGTVDVTVTTPWGTSATSAADQYTFVAPPPPPPPYVPPTGGTGGGSTLPLTTRLAGVDRVATSIAISQQSFADGTAGAVVLARSDDFADALAGAPLAVAHHAPLLLTGSGALDPRVAAEIQRVLPAGATVYLLGGTAALSAQVADQATALGHNVVRYGGPDRYATALTIAGSLGNVTKILLASGTLPPDAVAASAATGPAGTVILLTQGTTMLPSVSAFLAAHPVSTYAIGGPAATADPAATPVVGADRYATAVAVAETFFPSPKAAGITTGQDFADAVTAGPRLAMLGEPLLLTDPSTLSYWVSQYLTSVKSTLTHVEIYGGTAAVSTDVEQAITTLLGS